MPRTKINAAEQKKKEKKHELGSLIRHKLDLHHLEQGQLGSLIGRSEATARRRKRDPTQMTVQELCRMARALELSQEEVLSFVWPPIF